MADLPFFVELNEQNLTETLQRSVETPLVINFYAPSHQESADFAKVLQRVAEQHQGQFILGLVNCETEQMIAAQFRIQALPTTYLFKEAQAIDAFPGALDEASLLQRLSAILPKEEDLKFQKALDFLQVEDYDSALPLLKDAWELSLCSDLHCDEENGACGRYFSANSDSGSRQPLAWITSAN